MYGMRLLDTPNDQAPNGAAIETTCRLEIIPKTTTCHKYLPSLSTTCHVNPKKETKGLKTSFLTRLFCPGKIDRLKGGHYRDHPQTHTCCVEHSSMGHAAHQLSIRIPSGGHTAFLNSSSKRPHSPIRTSCPDPVLAS